MKNNRTKYGLRAKDRGLIYEGLHSSFKDALTDAVDTNIDLDGIDLTGMDLQNINLDGIHLSNANFANSNLSGANISEASLEECNFAGADLFDACFCYSRISTCDFTSSRFGMTDFAQADIINCRFAGKAAFSVSFQHANAFIENIYIHETESVPMQIPPRILSGLKNPIVFFGGSLLIGDDLYQVSNRELKKITNEMLQELTHISLNG